MLATAETTDGQPQAMAEDEAQVETVERLARQRGVAERQEHFGVSRGTQRRRRGAGPATVTQRGREERAVTARGQAHRR